jgi:hypothetical protein
MILVICDFIKTNFICYYKIKILKLTEGMFANKETEHVAIQLRKSMSRVFWEFLTFALLSPDIVVCISYIWAVICLWSGFAGHKVYM